MKNITLFTTLLFSIITYSQDINLEELISRHENIPINGNAVSKYFSQQEIIVLRNYLQSQNSAQNTTQQEGGGAIIYGANTNLFDFVNFSTGTPTDLNILGGNSGSSDFESAGEIDPENLDTAYVLTIEDGEFYELDLNTATYTFIGIIAPPSGEEWNGIEFDPSTNILYGISSTFSGISTLSTIDIDNLSSTPINNTGMPGAISIATDGEGNFFGHDVLDDNLYSIDITTGSATIIGPLGFDPNFGQGLEYDAVSGVFYMTAINNATLNSELRTVNVSTGATTFISFIGSENGANAQIPWASIANPSTLSVEDQEALSFTVFPNPVKDSMTIQSVGIINKVNIYNLLGQKIADQDTDKSIIRLDTSTYSPGTYIVTVTSDQDSSSYKFIKE